MLNERQEAFCLEYAKSANATQAAIDAGYSERTAYSQGQRLLKHVEVQEKLQALHAEMDSKRIADAEEMQNVLTDIIRSLETEETITTVGTGNGKSEIKVIHKAPALKDKLKAIELLTRMHGGFNDRATVDVCIPVFGGESELKE